MEVLETNTEGFDSQKLGKLLDYLDKELEVPYLERRKSLQLHKSNSVEELKETIQFLTEREKDLFAAVQIAKVLLKHNSDMLAQVNSLKNFNEELSTELQKQKQNTENLKTQHIEVVLSYEKALEEIRKLRDHAQHLDQKVVQLQDEASEDKAFQHLELMFSSKSANLQKQNSDLAASLSQLRTQKELLESQVDHLKHSNGQLKTANSQLATKAESLRKELNSVNSEKEKIKDLHAELIGKYKHLKEQKNQPDTHFIDHKDQFVKHSLTTSSLKSEICAIETPNEESPASVELEATFFPGSKELQVCTFQVAKVSPRKKNTEIRKSPGEEFFTLTTQAVKLNSPYMEDICTVSARELYLKAEHLDIPFHKWHLWIESQLNAYYINNMYRHEFCK